MLAFTLFGCLAPNTRHCPDVDCPGNEVCDNHGGCALPEQVSQCAGMPDGATCSYTDVATHHIDGTCFGGLCLPAGCGNGRLDADEVCDDGNNTSGDGCSADCRSNETCGNGHVDSAKNEQCDDGTNADGSTCEHDCLLPVCGNGILDPGLNEACDAGSASSNNPDAPCRPNCQLPRCGDGVVDPGLGELCDDANNTSGDGCSGDCKSTEVCGNSIVDSAAGEVCDDGNTTAGDGCSADCKSTETCGNGVVDTGRGEVCDDGNNISGDGCSADCRSQEICGNGLVDTINEQCDLGSSNSNNPDAACRTNCLRQRCGDAILDTGHGEQCDLGSGNANTPDTCRPSCQLPRCGDGIMDTARGEVCDDSNTVSGDGCSSDCNSNETCGNGIIDAIKGEQCDNGIANANAPDATCRTNCTRQKCGDGIVDDLFGEVCDLGAANSNAANAQCRLNCQPQRCGDGVIDTAAGEVCDDSNVVSGDGCSADCKSKETCGNGIVDTAKGEQCDAGASNSNAAPGDDKLDFAFADLDGKKVSINDERFKNKVVVIQIMGSWCPNCMDETAFLSRFYDKNKSRGIEMIALAYEYSEDFQRSQKSLLKFQQRFNVQYPILITGVKASDTLRTQKTLPQLTPIKTFPSTVFVGKDGKVKKIDTGFNGPGTGVHYEEYKKEFNEIVDELLINAER